MPHCQQHPLCWSTGHCFTISSRVAFLKLTSQWRNKWRRDFLNRDQSHKSCSRCWKPFFFFLKCAQQSMLLLIISCIQLTSPDHLQQEEGFDPFWLNDSSCFVLTCVILLLQMFSLGYGVNNRRVGPKGRETELNGHKQHERVVSGQKANGVRLTHLCQHHRDL